MNRLSVLEVVLLSAWLGAAIIVAAVVAPAAFKVLPTRTLAGAVVGQVLPVIFISGLVVGTAAVAIEARAGARFSRVSVAGPFIALIVGCVVAQFIIGPRIEALRATIGGALEALDASDLRRVQFGKLHGLSVLWMGIAMAGAGWAIIQKLTLRK